MRHRAASLGFMGAPNAKTEPAVGDDDNADSEELHVAADSEVFDEKLCKLPARVSLHNRPARVSSQLGPAQMENATPSGAGPREEGVGEADGIKCQAVAQDESDEITVCVEEQGVSAVDEATSRMPAGTQQLLHVEGQGVSTVHQATSGKPVGARNCSYCGVNQMLRTKHCHDCARCVSKFDHHCFWLGNCVGGLSLSLSPLPFLGFNFPFNHHTPHDTNNI